MPQNIEAQIEQLEAQVEELCEQEQYEEAIKISKKICELALQHYGYEHQDYATTLSDLAGLYQVIGEYQKAEQFYLQAIRIDEFALGKDSTDYASDLQDLARLYREMGKNDKAVQLYRQSLQIELKALGPEHPAYVRSLQELGKWLKQSNQPIARTMVKQAALSPTAGIEQQIISLNNEALTLYQRGLYEQALNFALQACDLAEQYLGEQHPDYATSLNNLAALHKAMGDYGQAEPLLQQAREIRRKVLSEEHPDYAGSLNNLALLYQAMGDYGQAEPLLQQAQGIMRKVLSEEHPAYATSLNNLAALYEAMGDYRQAEPLLQQAREIRRKALGEQHPDYAISLDNLAALYRAMGDYGQAEPLCQQAQGIMRKVLSEEHPDYATSLDNLADLYQAMGDYGQAEPLLQQAREIQRKVLSEEHPAYATSLNNLAALYRAMGDYAQAEPLLQQAREIRRTVLGEQHPDYATSLNNLALLYQAMGDYAAAEPLYQQTTAIRRKALGEQHPAYATSLNNLALLYQTMGDYAQAEPLLQQAREIQRTALGEQHPDYATSLNNLALLYQAMGDYAAAEPLYQQAREILRIALGEQHPDYATSLNNLAALYEAMGDYAQAEPLLQQAREIWRTALGEAHLSYATSLNNLAVMYAATARAKDALDLMQHAARLNDRMIGQIFSIGSEAQRTAYLKTIKWKQDLFLSLLCQLSDTATARHTALELILRRKAIGAEAHAAQRDAVLGGKYPTLEPKLRDLATLRMQIAQKTLAGPGPERLPAHQQLLTEWNARKDKLEAKLARQIPEMNLEQKLRDVDRQVVALALPAETTLVEFARFNAFDFKAVPARGEAQWKPARYLAFVLPAGEPDNVQMLDLGEAEPIDQMIATFRAAITGETEQRGGRDLGEEPDSPDTNAGETAGRDLRAALFDPLLAALGTRTRLLLAPDGDLTRLPFEVLPTADGRRLIDEYQISYLGAGRDVLRFGAASTGQPAAPEVIADPDFDLHATADQTSFAVAASPGRQSRDLDRSNLHFTRLPGTRIEGEQIAQMLGVQPSLAGAALEAQLKACRSPRILHLATHGFFLPDQKRDLNQELRAFGSLAGQSQFAGPGMENPLLRSGLALAGANGKTKGFTPPPEAEDGILTAEDVTGLDLLATDLVVLSACETGLGEVQIGEGVFGLRRSFVLAGAKTLVMSLWKVPDQQTQELMQDFYTRILAGQPRAEALRAAQLAMKKKHPEPLYWGAFICQGDPSPLPSPER